MNRFLSTIKQKNLFHITDNAWGKIIQVLSADTNSKGFLFFADNGGCNGFNYNLTLLDNKKFTTISTQNPNFIERLDNKVYIDPLSEMYLLGTTIDYINEDYSKGIFESKFIFTADKNLYMSCGCGISFTPKN